MTLRTPRRRISPRTKRRCRAIKDFLRRALGSTSQPDIKINSSIAVNVTNLKHQIVDIEQQLNEVSKHFMRTDCNITNDSRTSTARGRSIETDTVILKPETSTDRCSRQSKTKLLYKTHEKKFDDSDLVEKSESDRNAFKHIASKKKGDNFKNNTQGKYYKHKPNPTLQMEDLYPYFEKHKSKSAYEPFSTYSTNSYHSLFEPRLERTLRAEYEGRHHKHHSSRHARQRAHDRGEIQRDISHIESKEISGKKAVRNEEKHTRRRKDKDVRETRELDPDFINNIIKRQYRPIRMFGKKESNLSQFSAPVCRDQEFTIPENIIEGSDLCSCCYGDRQNRHAPYNDVTDMRSICDTRLYSSKRNTQQKMCRRPANNYNYNDSLMYDVVPVKEKSSPKSRRELIEDMMCYSRYKEVPPSPRTLRPRLNLKSQHLSNMDFDEDNHHRSRKYSPNRHNRRHDYVESYSNKSSTTIDQRIPYGNKITKKENLQQTVGTSSTLPPPLFNNETININQTQNANTLTAKSQDTESNTDKTDKALYEIKDILQSFLQEIKKESISHIDKDTSNNERNQSTDTKQNNIKINTSPEDPSFHSDVNNCNMSPFQISPPYLPSTYLNPCCYPVFPTYPVNCMQNGCVMPSPSFTCATCTNKVEQCINTNKENETSNETKVNTETDKLIKEIYNLVTQSPPTARKRDDKNSITHKRAAEKKKAVVTRSVGDSVRITRHDANVGTPKVKYYSKSCEAISSPYDEEPTDRTTASYSDTVLEKLSLDATAADSTLTETEISTEVTTEKKSQSSQDDAGNRFSKVLRSFGIKKKKKKDVIEEEEEEDSESESSTEVVVKKKRKRPEFPQQVTNYMMHGQEYFHQPQLPPHLHHDFLAHQQNLLHHHYPPYPGYPGPIIQPPPPPPPCPCAHECHHNQYHKQPDVPLCLKEIEVKSIATQSERKLPFFSKFGKRKTQEAPKLLQHNSMPQPKTCSTQTAQEKLSFWQKLQTPKPMTASDPRVFSFKKQKELAAGDAKIKNAMLKKLFHKRNPFSPRNLIVRTLMGRDPSSFGEPPAMYRPRMFL